MTLSKKAINLLLKVKAHILAVPKRYNQQVWCVVAKNKEQVKDAIDNGVIAKRSDLPECGTVGCIAGWICYLTPGGRKLAKKDGYIEAANAILGVGDADTYYLFGSEGLLPDEMAAAKTLRQRAKVGAKCIDLFIQGVITPLHDPDNEL
jgi:hypothetical protein